MDRNRIKSKISSLRKSKDLRSGKQREEKFKATKKILKRCHGRKSLPLEVLRLSTTDGFWSSPESHRSSRSASTTSLVEQSGTAKGKTKKPLPSKLPSKDTKRSESSSSERKSKTKSGKESNIDTSPPSAAKKFTSELRRLETSDGFWYPGIPENTELGKANAKEKEKDHTAAKAYKCELKRLQTTDGFWSPNFSHTSSKYNSRDNSPSSTHSSMDRVSSRSSVRQSEKKGEEDLKVSATETVIVDTVSPKRTRLAASVQENGVAVTTSRTKLMSDGKQSSSSHQGSQEPPPKRIKLSEKRSKSDASIPRNGNTPRQSSTKNLDNVTPTNVRKSASKTDSSLSSEKTTTGSQKMSSSNTPKEDSNLICDYLQSPELRRLNTTDGFWSPLPKISYMFSNRQDRSVRSRSTQPHSRLLEHRKRKLRSLKITARNFTRSLSGTGGRKTSVVVQKLKAGEKPVPTNSTSQDGSRSQSKEKPKTKDLILDEKLKAGEKPVPTNSTSQDGSRSQSKEKPKTKDLILDEKLKTGEKTVPNTSASQERALQQTKEKTKNKHFMFGAKKRKGRKTVSEELEQAIGGQGKATAKTSPNIGSASNVTKTWQRGRLKKVAKGHRSPVRKLPGRHSRHSVLRRSVEVLMDCGQKNSRSETKGLGIGSKSMQPITPGSIEQVHTPVSLKQGPRHDRGPHETRRSKISQETGSRGHCSNKTRSSSRGRASCAKGGRGSHSRGNGNSYRTVKTEAGASNETGNGDLYNADNRSSRSAKSKGSKSPGKRWPRGRLTVSRVASPPEHHSPGESLANIFDIMEKATTEIQKTMASINIESSDSGSVSTAENKEKNDEPLSNVGSSLRMDLKQEERGTSVEEGGAPLELHVLASRSQSSVETRGLLVQSKGHDCPSSKVLDSSKEFSLNQIEETVSKLEADPSGDMKSMEFEKSLNVQRDDIVKKGSSEKFSEIKTVEEEESSLKSDSGDISVSSEGPIQSDLQEINGTLLDDPKVSSEITGTDYMEDTDGDCANIPKVSEGDGSNMNEGVVSDDTKTDLVGVIEDKTKDLVGLTEDNKTKDLVSVIEDDKTKELFGVIEDNKTKDLGGVIEDDKTKDLGGVIEDDKTKELVDVIEDNKTKDLVDIIEDDKTKELFDIIEDNKTKELVDVIEDNKTKDLVDVIEDKTKDLVDVIEDKTKDLVDVIEDKTKDLVDIIEDDTKKDILDVIQDDKSKDLVGVTGDDTKRDLVDVIKESPTYDGNAESPLNEDSPDKQCLVFGHTVKEKISCDETNEEQNSSVVNQSAEMGLEQTDDCVREAVDTTHFSDISDTKTLSMEGIGTSLTSAEETQDTASGATLSTESIGTSLTSAEETPDVASVEESSECKNRKDLDFFNQPSVEKEKEVAITQSTAEQEVLNARADISSENSPDTCYSMAATSSDQSLSIHTKDEEVSKQPPKECQRKGVDEGKEEIESEELTVKGIPYPTQQDVMNTSDVEKEDPSLLTGTWRKKDFQTSCPALSSHDHLGESSSTLKELDSAPAYADDQQQNPLALPGPSKRGRKRRSAWSKGIVRKAKCLSSLKKQMSKISPSATSSTVSSERRRSASPVKKKGKQQGGSEGPHSREHPDNMAELAMQATKIVDISPDSDKPKKLIRALMRLSTHANLANASIEDKNLQTRARKVVPACRPLFTKQKKPVVSEGKVSVSNSQPLKVVAMKHEERSLPKLSPLGLAPSGMETFDSIDTTPPVLTPQQPIDCLASFDNLKGDTNLEDEVVNESVDDTDFQLYLSGTSDEEESSEAHNDGDANILSGTSKTNQGKSSKAPVILPAPTEVDASPSLLDGQAESDNQKPSVSQGSKIKGKKGKPPGIRVSDQDVSIQPRKPAGKSTNSVGAAPGPFRTFEFRKKTTRSPLEMIEMKRRQEEAVYDLEMQRLEARKISRRVKRIARVAEDFDDVLGQYYGVKPCSVVLIDFVKKLNLDQPELNLRENLPGSPYSVQYEDDSADEDWCADFEDVDGDEDECIEKEESLKRPHIPRLKLKRVPKVGKRHNVIRNLVSEMKCPEQEPLKLVIKTETLSDIEEPSKRLSSEPQGSSMFENNYVEFLKQRSTNDSPSFSKVNQMQLTSTPGTPQQATRHGNYVSNSGDSSIPTLTCAQKALHHEATQSSSSPQSLELVNLEKDESSTRHEPKGKNSGSDQNASIISTDVDAYVAQPPLPGEDLGPEEEEDVLILDLSTSESSQNESSLAGVHASSDFSDQIANTTDTQSSENSKIKAPNAQDDPIAIVKCSDLQSNEASPITHVESVGATTKSVIDETPSSITSKRNEPDAAQKGTGENVTTASLEIIPQAETSTKMATIDIHGGDKENTIVGERESSVEAAKDSHAVSSPHTEMYNTVAQISIVDEELTASGDSGLRVVMEPTTENDEAIAKLISSDLDRDNSVDQTETPLEDLATSNNNNNNVVKPSATPKSDNSSSPVHSTSQDPNDESRKLKTIPASYKQVSGSYKCKRCNFTAVSKLSIESHIYSHIPGVLFQCVVCQSEFSSMTAITNHFRNSHINIEVQCYISRHVDECNFYTISSEKEDSVTAQVTAGPEAQSPPFIISLVVSGARPFRANSASRRFVCTHCGFSTNVKEDVEQHVSDLHPAQTLYTCTLCKDSFGLSESKIKEHSVLVHPSRQRPYVKLPDFYDAEQLAKVEASGSPEECQTNVLRVSTLFPGDESKQEETPVGHQLKAKDYLYLQEVWKGKTSAEADSTTATDYSEENLMETDTAIEDEAIEETSKEGSSTRNSEAKSSSTDVSHSLDTAPAAAEIDSGDVSQIKITEVVSLSSFATTFEPDIDAASAVAPSPQTSMPQEANGNSNMSISGQSELRAEAAVTATSPSPQNHPENIVSRLGTTSIPSVSQVSLSSTLASSETASVTASSGTHCTSTTSLSSSVTTSKMPITDSSPLSALKPKTTSSSTLTSVTPSYAPSSSPEEVTSLDTPGEDHRNETSGTEDSSASSESSKKSLPSTSSEPRSSSSSSSPSLSFSGGLPLSYQCKACKVHTPYLLMMVRHLKSRHPKILCFSCPYCKSTMSFNTQKQLRHHVKSIHPEKVDKNEMSLSEEAKKFVEAMVLPKSHQCTRVGNRLILEEDIHTCTVCSLRMTSLSSVYDHLNEKHSDLFEFVCPVCQHFKNKSLQLVSDHCKATHKSELDKDKVHVSVPKYLFTILSCISKQGKYIEKTPLPSPTATSKDSSNSCKVGGMGDSASIGPDQTIDKSPVKSHAVQRTEQRPVQTHPPAPTAEPPTPPPAHSIPPLSLARNIPMQFLMKQTPLVALVASTNAPTTTRSMVAISSSLFDTSSLSLARPSSAVAVEPLPIAVSSRTVPQQLRDAKSSTLPVLNVPTIRPRSASVRQQQPPPQQMSANVHDLSKSRVSSTPLGGQAKPTPINQLPEDEPNPDAFKIFNLRPSGMTPPVLAAPASMMPQVTPTVFPPTTSSLSGYLPGPLAGFPAAMVIPPALLHSAFPYMATNVANPVRVISDGSNKSQGTFPIQSVQSLTPAMAVNQLSSPHLKHLSKVNPFRHIFPQQQLVAQLTTANMAGPSVNQPIVAIGQNPRYVSNVLSSQTSSQTVMDPVHSSHRPSTSTSSPSHFIPPHPGSSVQTTPTSSLNTLKRGRKSSTLYKCPYCSQPLKALEVTSHIRHAHPGCQVSFQKAV